MKNSEICLIHPKYMGKRKPTTKFSRKDGCSCHDYWEQNQVHKSKETIIMLKKKYAFSILKMLENDYFENSLWMSDTYEKNQVKFINSIRKALGLQEMKK